MTTQLETFRVYTGVRRIIYEFAFGGLRMQVPSFLLATGVLALTLLAAAPFLAIGGIVGAVLGGIVILLGMIVFVAILIAVARMSAMKPPEAAIPEKTQVRMIRRSAGQPWHVNYREPDALGERFYRNY